MDADEIVVAYRKCQRMTEDYNAVAAAQAYIDPEIAFGHTVKDVVALLPSAEDYDYYLKTVSLDGLVSKFRKISSLQLEDGLFSTLLGVPK